MAESTDLPANPKPTGFASQFLEPIQRLRGEVDRIFDEFPARWPSVHLPERFGLALPQTLTQALVLPMPAIGMTEKPDAYTISVEVPGIEAGAIELAVEGDTLVLKGEKREEREEKEQDYRLSERSYGAFERRIPLPADALADQIEAKTKDGVLKITVPRNHEAAPERRKIEIKSAKKD